ncbi:MAG: hypothetical protein P8X74_16445 [Reinekea sp.]
MLTHLLLDQLLMTAPVRLDEYVIHMLDRHRHFSFPTGFDQTAIAQVTAQPQVTLCIAQYDLNRPLIKGIDAEFDDPVLTTLFHISRQPTSYVLVMTVLVLVACAAVNSDFGLPHTKDIF